jgi:hypothetical protein
MSKPVFLYATGTAFFINVFGMPIGAIGGSETVITYGGKDYRCSRITDDPFWTMLDPQVWDSRKINYPAAIWPMGPSIDTGVSMTIDAINNLPSGTPFCLGGYSQGAAVMSKVYNELKSGSLTSRWSSFKGGVVFGNPMRQQDFLAPGLTWSGRWDVSGSTTGGSGCFPTRLSSCDYGLWNEYVLSNDIINSTGTSTNGAGWRSAVGWLTAQSDPITSLIGLLTTDWLGGIAAATAVSPQQHALYATLPPTGLTGPTCYELALSYLASVATSVYTTTILPPTDPTVAKTWTTLRPA